MSYCDREIQPDSSTCSDVQGAAKEAFWNGSFSTPAIDTPGVKVDSPNVTNIAPGVVYLPFRSIPSICKNKLR
jgi:hypothetical protein